MIRNPFPSATEQTLNLGNNLIAGRKYVIGVTGTAVAFSIQFNVGAAGWVDVAGLTGLTASATTILQTEVIAGSPGIRLDFDAAPGTYHAYIQEVENHSR